VLRVPILPLSTIFQMKVEAVLTVWYFVSFILFFSIKLYTTYTCFVVRSELLFVLVFCVALCFVVLLVFVLFLVCPKMPVSLDRPIFISSSVFYNVYCRVKFLLFAIEYFILLQTQPSNRLKIVFHNCCCVVSNTKRTPFGIKLLIAIFGW
jgi:hypothetical protein